MSASGGVEAGGGEGREPAPPARQPAWRDPRVWLALGVTALFAWLALRGVPLGEVWRAIAGAHWGILLGVSVPSYLFVLQLRALRWRILTDPIQPIAIGPLYRALAVGFAANNLLPLRIGEVVRVWYLRRETGASAAALFGTVILERVFDALSVIALAALVVSLGGAGEGGSLAQGALWLVPVALVPAALLVGLRVAPERIAAAVGFALRPFPRRLSDRVQELLRRFQQGLGALRTGWHLLALMAYSAGIWGVGSTLPVLAGFWALDLDLGRPLESLLAACTTLVAVAVAVALPQAPGFFGPYHYAARLALTRFGVPPESAVALGTLIHAVMWLTLSALGLAVLRLRRTSLAEIGGLASGPGDGAAR